MRRLQPAPASGLVSELGSVEIVTYRNRGYAWLFLLNHGGEQFTTVGQAPWRRTVEPLPRYEVTVRVRGGKPAAVRCAGHPLPFRHRNGQVEMALTLDRRWKIVRINWR